MAIEIERKFIVEKHLTDELLGAGVEIRQGYLAEEGDVTVRIRMTPAVCTVTMKAGSGLSRVEVEFPLDRDDAESLWPSTDGRRVEKTRHRVPVGEHTAEVDVFAGALAGLVVVEVEFDAEDTALAFDPPEWFGRELTDEPAWSNAALARNGRPDS